MLPDVREGNRPARGGKYYEVGCLVVELLVKDVLGVVVAVVVVAAGFQVGVPYSSHWE